MSGQPSGSADPNHNATVPELEARWKRFVRLFPGETPDEGFVRTIRELGNPRYQEPASAAAAETAPEQKDAHAPPKEGYARETESCPGSEGEGEERVSSEEAVSSRAA